MLCIYQEATFFGRSGHVLAGSDDGNIVVHSIHMLNWIAAHFVVVFRFDRWKKSVLLNSLITPVRIYSAFLRIIYICHLLHLMRFLLYIVLRPYSGRMWVWKPSGDPLIAPHADDHILNCVRTHPVDPVIATSGIESTIKLWAPSSPIPAITDEVNIIVLSLSFSLSLLG